MAINLNILSIPLNGTGTEIPTLNVTDPFEKYVLTGTATATGNYAIVPTGTPQQGTTFIFKYKAVLDITTNSKTFSIFGQALTQNQLTSDLDIEAYYDNAAWIVEVKPSFTSAVVEAANLLANSVATTHIQNGAVTEVKLATNSVSTNKILNLNVTTGKIADLGVTDAKINDVNGSKIVDNTVTNAKLADMANQTIKGNVSGGSAVPSDISIPTLFSSNAWLLTGNAGTTAGTNFIGTTDNVDLVLKRNSVQSGIISPTNISFGVNSLDSNTTGIWNVSFGTSTLTSNTSGSSNTALGYNSLLANTTGSANVAVGSQSLLVNDTGGANVALGGRAGVSITSGNNNTFIGYEADSSSAIGTNRIALGYGAEVTADYQFAIPDDVTTIKFRGLVYNLPTSQAAGVLTNDGSGNLTWV